MSIQLKSALLAGASGLIGQEVLKQLLENRMYSKVTVLVRRRLQNNHPKLEQVVVDFDHLEEYAEYFQVDDVFCCLGTTMNSAGSKAMFRKVDFDYPVAMGRLSLQTGVKQFMVVTALGADAKSRVFYSRVKGELEEELSDMGLLGLHIYQPSLLLGERAELRLGERLAVMLSPVLKMITVGGWRKYRPIHGIVVAGSMVNAAQKALTGVHKYTYDEIYELIEIVDSG